MRYWNDRFRLFGPDKFVLPLTLKGALKDDALALSRGYVQLLADTDTAGRAVLYLDWSSHEPSIGYSEDSMHRVVSFCSSNLLTFVYFANIHISLSLPS